MAVRPTPRPATAVTAGVAALCCAGLVAGSAASAAPAAARAASPWVQLSTGDGVSISYEPSVARWGNRLIVVWPQDVRTGGTTGTAINSRVVSAAGKPSGPVSNVVTWASVSSDPAVLTLGGVPTVAFGGLRTTDSTDAYTGPMAYAQAGDAASWTLGAGSLTQTRSAYGDYGLGAVDDGTGQPIVALAASSTDQVTVHHGIDPEVPAAAPDEQVAPTDEAQAVSLARDPATGTAWAAWYSGGRDSVEGIHAAQVYPTVQAPVGPAPLSSVPYDHARESVNPGQNVAVAGRIGGGVWAAYASGYPSPHKLVLWNPATGRTLALSRTTGEIQYVGLSPAPGGRLWVWWIEGGTVYATRTNPAVTSFGAIRSLAAPGGYSPTRTAGDGSLGPLDVVINQALGSAPSQISTARIVEALQVSVRASRRGAKEVFTVAVSDAGVPVPGAGVRLGSFTAVTNSRGAAVFTLAAAAAKGTHIATARASGYLPGSARVLVR